VIGDTYKTVPVKSTAKEMAAYNTFDKPEAVKPESFAPFSLKDGSTDQVKMPSKSVVVLELKKLE